MGNMRLREVVRVPVDRLALDRNNPRLTNFVRDPSDEEITAQLYRKDDLSELLQSIAANGYLDIEPLIVLEENERLVVLEGNRRLAAIRLFRDPGLVALLRDRMGLRITLPELPEKHRATLDQVSVYGVGSRAEARPFIGFKHINGAAKWDSWAKARFATRWHRDGEVSLSDIAACIGDKHDTVKRMVNAIYVLEQAEDAGVFRVEDRFAPRFNFSHLYTALSRAPYMEFLGLNAAWSRYDPKTAPVPADRVERLSDVMRWIYGSKAEAIEPVVRFQNPDIKRLGEVLANAAALTVLKSGGSLSDAWESAQPAAGKFSEALLRTRDEIRNVSHNLRGFDGRAESLLDMAEDIYETAAIVRDRMRKKAREAIADDE